ncbi:MAG: hypothetical protein Q4A98_00730 [Comamonadaceae bacterium]|nr:hypothetical protein [Comamonadaceae bacterium]
MPDQTTTNPLRQLRELSGHSAAWCAAHVGHVSLRSWNYWESGTKQGRPVRVPDDVMQTMQRLADAVQQALAPTQPGN